VLSLLAAVAPGAARIISTLPKLKTIVQTSAGDQTDGAFQKVLSAYSDIDGMLEASPVPWSEVSKAKYKKFVETFTVSEGAAKLYKSLHHGLQARGWSLIVPCTA
jgi:hypothetical protein